MVRAAGATEVHMRVSSPPIMHSCFYGIGTPGRSELLASGARHVDAMARLIGVDSLPSSRSTASIARSAGPAATRTNRTTAMPASRATTRSPDPTQGDNADRQLSLLVEEVRKGRR